MIYIYIDKSYFIARCEGVYMKISKTLFKNLTRCPNFLSYYDIYINRFLHEVKEIDGKPVSTEQIEELDTLDENLFTEEDDHIIEILSDMFDSETGMDLTQITSAQMEAFSDTFTEVERLASVYIETLFGKKVIASTNTYEQKKFSYKENGNTFYCYLDVYLEDEAAIKVFEVKATTSRKYDEFFLTFNRQKFPFFEKTKAGITKYVGKKLIEKGIDETKILKKEEQLFNRYTDVGKYIYDIAVERNIIEHAIAQMEDKPTKQIEYYLVTLNSEYCFDGTYDSLGKPVYKNDARGNALFKIYDMNYLSEHFQEKIHLEKEQLFQNQNRLIIQSNLLSNACEYKKTTECKFCKICMKKVLQDGSILEYLNKNYAFSVIDAKGKRKCIDIYQLINTGHYSISDCYSYLSKPENITQYYCYQNNEIYMDKKRIQHALEHIQYPIYHLDFESYNCPLPRYFGEHPYQQSLFQYSLHKEIAPGICDIEKDHTEFLAKDHKDHRKELAKQLIQDIDLSHGGCVMVYNQSFEKTRLKELATFFPEYKEELDNINHHIFDLLEVLRGKKDESQTSVPRFTYYHNQMHGSFSIKKVLPLFTNLSYRDLDVRNGTEAILTYGMLEQLTEKEYNEKYLALRIYCRQDTWAMVEILKGLRKLVESI